jgi:16S rRNA (adenine(1408)-N(1))-methyltransferase
MADVSRRAARSAARGGQPNALFVVAAIESPPVELVGRADLVTVRFPWRSLLRGTLGLEPRAMAGLASLAGSTGRLEALLSVEARDGLGDLAGAARDEARLSAAWAALGFELDELRLAEPEEVAASGSSWARRLGATSAQGRPVMCLRLSRLP